MKLTQYTDYALRVMIHLAAHPDALVSIRQIADSYQISQNHLMKVVNDLGRAGFVSTSRGRNGGLRLARPADEITVGAIVRHTEGHALPVDCKNCLIAPACGLPSVLAEAMEAFMQVLDRYRLSELALRPDHLRRLFGLVRTG